jgi:hypothetical protein
MNSPEYTKTRDHRLNGMEKAEESFTKGSQPDRPKELEHTFDVINERVKSIFDLMLYISKYKKIINPNGN